MNTKFLKKMISIMIAGTAIYCLAACSSEADSGTAVSDQTEENTDSGEAAETENAGQEESTAEGTGTESTAGEENAIIVYFSWSGNTEAVAQEIQNQTDADLFEIVPAQPYTDDYDELLDIAQEEQRSDARPAIADTVDLSGYDTVYLGFPKIQYVFLSV